VQILVEFSPGLINEKYAIVFKGKPNIGDTQHPRVRFSPILETNRDTGWADELRDSRQQRS
jgi:hypothetical protein